MKLFLWTNKLLFLITIFFASLCVIMNFIDLSFNRSGKSYYELINVCNISPRHEHLRLCYCELDTFMGF